MRASQKMEKRIALHDRLTVVDQQLALTLSRERSNRVSELARGLLRYRSGICKEMAKVGYQPWALPLDPSETKVM